MGGGGGTQNREIGKSGTRGHDGKGEKAGASLPCLDPRVLRSMKAHLKARLHMRFFFDAIFVALSLQLLLQV